MGEMLKTKAIGFYFTTFAGIIAVLAMIRFLMWAPNHGSVDAVITAALTIGIVVDVILVFKDNEYLTVIATACYSVALVKLLTNSVGSFVDAFQGIQMFGDATQVGTIISISEVIAISILASIIASFLKRVKK